ncbi:hypothetical protein SGH10_005233 (plasmid) [Klebsiella pneumoniae]|uniref:Uncharacterized protein n=1 Tax=Klebsiella pneumoniae TaxID=573 RepID=A0A6G9HSZ9_KLEPN|nr:hypothetical protein SGH10_005233 [Klebsiella pneumoniae]QIQ14173.1 hypothetical protein [Klebsiella pneumoniae]QVQ58003.1 hypothetical protein [Klebsiella pneumoniae]
MKVSKNLFESCHRVHIKESITLSKFPSIEFHFLDRFPEMVTASTK